MSPIERSIATLRVTSPCEHGVEHEFTELKEGCYFGTSKCRDSRGHPKSHHVTKDKYPQEVRRR